MYDSSLLASFSSWSVLPSTDIPSNSHLQAIAIFGSIFRNTVNPAQFGVVLTYALHAALGTYHVLSLPRGRIYESVLTALVPLFAVCEQEMVSYEMRHRTKTDNRIMLKGSSTIPSFSPSQLPLTRAIQTPMHGPLPVPSNLKTSSSDIGLSCHLCSRVSPSRSVQARKSASSAVQEPGRAVSRKLYSGWSRFAVEGFGSMDGR